MKFYEWVISSEGIRESLKSIGSPTAKQLNKAEEFEKTSKHKLWEKVLSLSSWEQMVDSEPNNFNSIGLPRHKYCDIRDRVIDYEAAILNIYDIRQSVANTGAFKRLNTSEALFSLQDELSSFAHFLLLGGCGKTDGFFHSKIATLHSLCTGIQHLSPHLYPHQKNFVQPFIKQMRSPTKQSGSTPILLELDLSDLLRQCKKDSLHRLSLAQSYCGWMHRLYGRQKEYSYLVRKMHQDVAKLAYDLGNPQLCAIHQRLANIGTLLPEEISSEEFNHSQFDILPEHHRPFVLPQFHMQQQNVVAIKSAPPGFAPILLQQPAVNVDFPVSKFETGVNSISQGLLSEDFDGDTLRLLANESATMLQFGINICSEQGRHLEEIIGQCSTFEEFRAHVSNSFPITDISIITAAILTAIDQPAFSQLWLTIKHRQYRLYELALNSHLRFLENLFPGKSRIQTIEVILRLLKMLTRQPDWFERIAGGSDARERHGWMDRISKDVWTEVIPQLFACLNHPKPIVCDTIQLLLEKIGKQAPHSICYPAIVIVNEANEKGASLSDILLGSLLTRSRKRHENLVQQEDIDPLTSLRELKSIDNVIVSFKNIMELKNDGDMDDGRVSKLSIKMAECCKSLIRSLTIHYPEIVKDTMEFCRALQRIALLYEEQWFYVLTQFDHHLSRLMRSLPPITPYLDERLLKFLEKILISLRSLNSITCLTEPESENEKQFCQTYREIIQQALNTLEQNLNSNPPVAWEPFKKLIVLLNKQALKRSSLCLSIPKLSIYLGGFSAKMVPIPCQEMRKFGEMITVQKMAKLAFVLPTKTRPKKIALIGSDGKTYTFLFKGQENLYMDNRLMQFLRICNTIFNDLKNHHQMDMDPPYQCTSYSVTPLGSRSGLIEWVDGAIPLFQIYRKWRIRQLQFLNENEGNKQQKIAMGLTKNPIPTEQFKGINKETRTDSMAKKTKELEPERPMEQFYHKLKTIFALHRIPKEHLTDRKHWPKELVKQVVKELMEETSKDILAKEFWMHAGTSESWWIVTQQFARTVAVSSMLGSLIGLGDRHLDNVLVNLVTGQIVHVDYNICFGKGRALRVPETVPFRLTGNIVMALGPTKIDGTFRQSSERVLEMLRADKHVLRQLMETLKFDPMLDFNFLQNNMELRDKNQEEIADCLVHGMSRKLMGYELKYNNPPLSSRASPGLIKLDGKEPTEPEKEKHNVWIEKETTTVKEQVNLLVGEATDLSNLALMYEGWTAWV